MKAQYLCMIVITMCLLTSAVFAKSIQSPINNVQHIVANGHMDIIIASARTPSLRIAQDGTAADEVYAHVQNHTLFLCTGNSCTYRGKCLGCSSHHKLDRSTVYLRLPILNSLDFAGKGKVVARKVKSHGLRLNLHNCGSTWISGDAIPLRSLNNSGCGPVTIAHVKSPSVDIHLAGASVINIRGIIDLKHLAYSGNGSLNIYWLDSDHVKVDGKGSAQAFIAGVAKEAHIDLSQHAYLDARYLRSKEDVIKTRDYSRADVTPLHVLNALAVDHSNIYYYKDPISVNTYMRGYGSVLRMADLHTRCTPEVPLYTLASCPLIHGFAG